MFKKIINEALEVAASPTLYILALAAAGTGFIFFGVQIILGDGAAFITLGIMLLVFMIALSRSVSGE